MRVLFRRMVDHEPWWAEWWAAVAALAWCAAVVNMGGMGQYPGFAFPLQVAPEWVWYAVCVFVPLAQLWALRRDERRARFWACFLMAWWWTFVGLAVVTRGVAVPSLTFYLVFAGMNLNSVLRLRLERA